LWEFHQIYNSGAVGDEDELNRFWSRKRLKFEATTRPNMVEKALIEF